MQEIVLKGLGSIWFTLKYFVYMEQFKNSSFSWNQFCDTSFQVTKKLYDKIWE